MNKRTLLGTSVLLGLNLTGCQRKIDLNENINAYSSKNSENTNLKEDKSNTTNSSKENESTEETNLSSNLESAYALYIENEKPLYLNGILVVNKTFGLPRNYASSLQPEVIDAYNLMKADAQKDGIILNIRSGFRDTDTQEALFNTYVQRDGIEKANRYSAKPGHSEHETGLAIDITDEHNNRSIGDWFNETEQAKWLYENAYKYGFILRYPKGKEHITGYKYESWHYRYVGIEHSKNFAMNDLTLEEYLQIVTPQIH